MGRHWFWKEIRAGIGRHPLRSFLVSFTFALGFAATLITIATVEGGRRSVREMLNSLGVDVIACFNPVRVGPLLIGRAGGKEIDQSTIDALRSDLGTEEVRAVVPMRIELIAVYGGRNAVSTTLISTSPEFAGVLRSGLLAGRFLEPQDRSDQDPDRADVVGKSVPAVLDEALARELVDDPAAAVGHELSVFRGGRALPVRVVGVMKDPLILRQQLDTFDVFSQARQVTARRLEFKNLYILYSPAREKPSGVLVQVRDPGHLEHVDERLRQFLEDRDMEPLYVVQKSWVDSLMAIVDQFSFLANFLSIVDLLGVLILAGTIAMLAIEERYFEVALRRAEGARVWQVVTPLLAEGVVLATLALPVGWALATWTLRRWVEPILLWKPVVAPSALYGTALLLVLVAAATNILPARRVARLSPARVLAEQER